MSRVVDWLRWAPLRCCSRGGGRLRSGDRPVSPVPPIGHARDARAADPCALPTGAQLADAGDHRAGRRGDRGRGAALRVAYSPGKWP